MRFPVINGIFNLYCFDFCLRISSYPQRFLVHFVKMVLAPRLFVPEHHHAFARLVPAGLWNTGQQGVEARGGGKTHAHAATARCLPVRALGVRISVHRLLHPFCTTFSVLQLCAVSRARPDPPTRRRAPGPGMLGPGRCGCARVCAPGRSRRPAARRPPRTRPDPQSAGTGVPAFRRVFACSPRAVWSMLYTPAPAFTPCAPSNASKLQQTETAATNSWLFCSPCGRRFAADAGTQRTCNIDALHEQTSLGGRDRLVWQTVTD